MTFRFPSAVAFALILGACGQETSAPKPDASSAEAQLTVEVVSTEVVYDRDAVAYTLSWALDSAAPVSLYVSTNRDGSGAELVAENITASSFTWTPQDGNHERRYFIARPDGAEQAIFAARLLPLEGGRNFRDLGGYQTADGRQVKWGHVYRSGVMDGLTDADYDYLSDLGIKVVCDFREEDERLREPTEWKAGKIDYLTFVDPAAEEDERDNPMFAALMSPESTPEDVAAGFAASYFPMALNEAEGYAAMFDRLAAGEIPLAFNCSAGKDRAGTAAALLLTALGVPRETVVHDYSLSDDYVDYMAEFAGEEARAEAAADPDNPYAFLMQLPPEKLAPLMASDPRYIEASLDEMEARYGSVIGFIQTELDVTDGELESIRRQLLR
ncbi:MAG: tyrosine-protein phosphatase [Pseudomonadota bacterium]